MDSDGKTALHKAAQSKRGECFKVLEELCPEAQDIEDKGGKKPKDYL